MTARDLHAEVRSILTRIQKQTGGEPIKAMFYAELIGIVDAAEERGRASVPARTSTGVPLGDLREYDGTE